MAKYTIIGDVGMEIVTRLRQGMTPQPIKDPDKIGLANPMKKPEYMLSVFLYDIVPMNASLAQVNAPVYSRGQPLALKYMLCASSQADLDRQAVEEQRMIGRVIQVLCDNPVIRPVNHFLGENDLPVSIVLENLNMDDRNKMYSTMGGFWTAVFYEASPVFLDMAGQTRAPRVMKY